jgi:hypothetical protein
MAHYTYQYRIELTSDAEPGTGLGGEVLNEIVPRDAWGRPMLDGTHIKGLMSQALRDIAVELWHPAILKELFGQPHIHGLEGASLIRVGAATAPADTAIRMVTRTAVSDAGTAQDRTLRTTEVAPVGTVYEGVIETSLEPGSAHDLAWRLALLSITAVGSGRSRGSGLCVTKLVGPTAENRSPGQLLRLLHEHFAKTENRLGAVKTAESASAPAVHPVSFSSRGKAVALRLVFAADSPVCCPETTSRTNVIESGFSIPASAVQGMLLTHLGQSDQALATALFAHDHFRAWPMQPCARQEKLASAPSAVGPADQYPISIRVSLTHRTAKFSTGVGDNDSDQSFEDEAIEHYDWTKTVNGSPLKASDGVLLYGGKENGIALWKAGDMPRVVTAHGVHHDENTVGGRNLFTMNAMAPMVWQGLLSVPEEAAERILKRIAENPRVAVGKSRSVRGLGRLSARIETGIPREWRTVEHQRTDKDPRAPQVTLFIVQSPLRIPHRSMESVSAEKALRDLVTSWTTLHKLPGPIDVWPNAGVRFGWNRMDGKRLPACFVILPGSVFALPAGLDPQVVARAIQSGIGDPLDRQRGFGAVVIHPGKASSLVRRSNSLGIVSGDQHRKEAVSQVLKLVKPQGRLPSTSQVRAVQQRLERAGPVAAIQFLEKQREERPPRIWGAWEPIHQPLVDLIKKHQERPAIAVYALEVLADLALMATREERH